MRILQDEILTIDAYFRKTLQILTPRWLLTPYYRQDGGEHIECSRRDPPGQNEGYGPLPFTIVSLLVFVRAVAVDVAEVANLDRDGHAGDVRASWRQENRHRLCAPKFYRRHK